MIQVRRFGPHTWGLGGSYSQALRNVCKAMPGMSWNPAARGWFGYADAVDAVVSRLRQDKIQIVGDVKRIDSESAAGINVCYESLRDYQKTGVNFLVAHATEGCLLADDTGIGKQQPVDTRVLTPTGWRRIGRLKVGDCVIGSDGRPTRVTGVFPQGVKPVYRVHFSDHSSVETGPEHLWSVLYWRGGKTLSTLKLTTDQLRTRPLIGKLDLSGVRLLLPMLAAPVVFDELKALPLDGYTLGALIANGYLCGLSATLTFNTADTDTIRARTNIGSINVYGATSRGVIAGAIASVRQLELNVRSAAKFIPRCYMTAPVETRIALLQGLLDGDGSCASKLGGSAVVYHTTSSRLAEDVRELVECLGGSSSIRRYDRRAENKPIEFQVRVRLPEWVQPFSTVRKSRKYIRGRHANPVRSVDRVEYTRDSESVCISVAAEDALYLTEHCILTHNTIQSIRAARAFKERTVVVCPAFVKRHWEAELKLWWPDAKVQRLETLSAEAIDFDVNVVVINFDILRAWAPWIIEWGAKTFICDELHYLMSFSSKRTSAARDVARTCLYRIGLTATPKPSHVRDLWAALDVLSEARFGDKFFAFGLRYAGGKQETIEVQEEGITVPRVVWRFDGSSHEEELSRRLSFMMLRRTKAEVSLQLPQIIRQVIEIDVKKNFKLSSVTSNKELRRQLDVAAAQKIPQVIDMSVDDVAAGNKIVVFTYRKADAHAIAEGIQNQLPWKARVETVTGEVSQQKRHDIVRAQPDVLCCTMDSMGVGISLAYADIATFAGLHYVPSTLYQCESRLPRPDSKSSSKLIRYVCARGTADDLIRRVVIAKMTIDQKIVGRQSSKLLEDLEAPSKEDAATKLKRLYERMLKEDE